MNKVILMGRLTREPEVRYTRGENPTAVASFGLAVDRRFKRVGDETTDFFECTAWGKLAEHMEKWWRKGMKALVSGRLENETWTGKDGVKRVTAKIIVEEIDFCEKRQEEKDLPLKDEELPFEF